jgi:hypothetical protein
VQQHLTKKMVAKVLLLPFLGLLQHFLGVALDRNPCSRLEKRLVANVDFDDQALNALGFGTDIYYMLGHLG